MSSDDDRKKVIAQLKKVASKKCLFKKGAKLVLRYQKARAEMEKAKKKIIAHLKKRASKKNLFRKADKLALRYQKARAEMEKAQRSIIKNYRPFCLGWRKAFSGYLNEDLRAGESLHDQVVLQAVSRFRPQRGKPVWRYFNAYLVSCLLNRLKNLRYAASSTRRQCLITKGDVVRLGKAGKGGRAAKRKATPKRRRR